MYCGTCEGYANPRKRKRSLKLKLNYMLPGTEQNPHTHILHPECKLCKFTRLRKMLPRLDDKWQGEVVMAKKAMIPDALQHRGYDFATSYFYYPDIENSALFWDEIVEKQIIDMTKGFKKG